MFPVVSFLRPTPGLPVRARGIIASIRRGPGPTSHRWRLIDGTFWSVLAQALALPTGLITTGYLTRRLGPEDFGLFVLAMTVATWLAWSIAALCPARAVIKLVAGADDWRPIGKLVLWVHLSLGLGGALLLLVSAPGLASFLSEPALAFYFSLVGIEVLLLNVSQAHRKVLIGLNGFRRQALAVAGRWTARVVAIVLFVEAGLSVAGALLGSAVAVVVELVIHRSGARLPLSGHGDVPIRRLVSQAVPLFLFLLCLQIVTKVDLIALKALGGSAAEAGIYGAAQTLASIPGLLTMVIAPLLLTALSRLIAENDVASSRRIVNDALRFILALLPFAAMTAGVADEVVPLIFGSAFAPAAPILATLIFGGVAMVAITILTVVPIVADRPRWPLGATLPMLVLCLAGHAVVIPSYGAEGAAVVTTVALTSGAVVSFVMVHRLWGAAPPWTTTCRSVAISVLVFAVATTWPVDGAWWIIMKFVTLIAMVPLGFVLLGEISGREVERLRQVFSGSAGGTGPE